MRTFVFSLAFCLLLIWVLSGAEAQGPTCNTTIVEERVNTFLCGLRRVFGGKCTKIKTRQVCIFPPTAPPSPNPTGTQPTATGASTTTTDPISAIDCSLEIFFPDSEDPTQYYQCQGNIPVLSKCPVTRDVNGGPDLVQVWDQQSNSCMTTPTGTVSCREPTGRQPDPSYCNLYIDCQNDVQSKIRCEAGFRYNDVRKDCIVDPTCIDM